MKIIIKKLMNKIEKNLSLLSEIKVSYDYKFSQHLMGINIIYTGESQGKQYTLKFIANCERLYIEYSIRPDVPMYTMQYSWFELPSVSELYLKMFATFGQHNLEDLVDKLPLIKTE